MTCRTPEQSAPRGTSCKDDMRGNREGTRDEMRGNREGTRGHMYPDKNRVRDSLVTLITQLLVLLSGLKMDPTFKHDA